ncbi:hypothetical protein RGR602_CH01907 [Rhizobium gallicum bv. gallicum R602sp]|uniref:Uncharacterized protein n=1 Tax=Rhizobium gallicum bv. gallicum R602sp TaxID=1041138 RepID=A0A0B4X408_9HYPH|nr:hypothetical protein RGR602_CH01907 [Rhizobium gallicum bv. gallicum R602sp]
MGGESDRPLVSVKIAALAQLAARRADCRSVDRRLYASGVLMALLFRKSVA